MWNLSRTWDVSGPLDLTALERALSEIVQRHESLRTRYLVVGGEPVQEVMPAAPVAIELVDARESASRVRQARIFAAAGSPRLRPGLTRDGPGRRRHSGPGKVRADAHPSSHLLGPVVVRHFSTRALSRVRRFRVGPRAFPPGIFVCSSTTTRGGKARHARSESTAAALAEAVEALKGMPDESALVASSDRHASASGPGGRVTSVIPAPVVRALRTLAHSHEATLFMALMAIFNALVYRLTNQTDLVVVTPTAGRVHPELESLIGQFANVLPLRTDLAGDPSFLDLLARVQRGTTRLFAHQHVPIQRLQAALRPGWTGARMAMSSLLFALQNVPHDDLRLTGTDVRAIESGSHEMFEDLSLFASEGADGALVLRADYRADRIDESTIRRSVDDFAAIAAHVVDQPATRLSDLPTQALDGSDPPAVPVERHRHRLSARCVRAGAGRAPGRADARCGCGVDGATRVTLSRTEHARQPARASLEDEGRGAGGQSSACASDDRSISSSRCWES